MESRYMAQFETAINDHAPAPWKSTAILRRTLIGFEMLSERSDLQRKLPNASSRYDAPCPQDSDPTELWGDIQLLLGQRRLY